MASIEEEKTALEKAKYWVKRGPTLFLQHGKVRGRPCVARSARAWHELRRARLRGGVRGCPVLPPIRWRGPNPNPFHTSRLRVSLHQGRSRRQRMHGVTDCCFGSRQQRAPRERHSQGSGSRSV